MKPVKLKRHVATKHAEFKNKPIEFIERKFKNLCQQKVLIEHADELKFVSLSNDTVSKRTREISDDMRK
jgi:hypothetical protein